MGSGVQGKDEEEDERRKMRGEGGGTQEEACKTATMVSP